MLPECILQEAKSEAGIKTTAEIFQSLNIEMLK